MTDKSELEKFVQDYCKDAKFESEESEYLCKENICRGALWLLGQLEKSVPIVMPLAGELEQDRWNGKVDVLRKAKELCGA